MGQNFYVKDGLPWQLKKLLMKQEEPMTLKDIYSKFPNQPKASIRRTLYLMKSFEQVEQQDVGQTFEWVAN